MNFFFKNEMGISFLQKSLSPLHRWHYLFNSHNQFSFFLFFWPGPADIKMWDMFVVGNWRKRGGISVQPVNTLNLDLSRVCLWINLNNMKLLCFKDIIIYKTYMWFIEGWMKQTKNNGQQCTNKWANWHTFFTSLKHIFLNKWLLRTQSKIPLSVSCLPREAQFQNICTNIN